MDAMVAIVKEKLNFLFLSYQIVIIKESIGLNFEVFAQIEDLVFALGFMTIHY